MRIVKKSLNEAQVAKALVRQAPIVRLSFDLRRRSRQKITLNTGEDVGVFLEHGTVLRNGDLLLADDGKFIRVEAASESISRVSASTPRELARAAYHLGNRHVLVEVGPDYLHLEYDPVLVEMLERLGMVVETVEQPFEPESGAYGGGHKHGHDETFQEDYALAQAAYNAREPLSAKRRGAAPMHSHAHHHSHEGDHDHHEHSHDHGSDHDHDHDHEHRHGKHD